jgi:hypothetical protein
MQAVVVILILFLLSSPGKAAQQTIFSGSRSNETSVQREDLIRLHSDDIWPKTLSGSHYNELWNYQFYFDNGISLYVIFSVTNFGKLKSAVSGVRVSMYGFDGQEYHLSREYPIQDLLQDKTKHAISLNSESFNVWFGGKLPQTHSVYINTSKNDVRYTIDLSFRDIVPGYRLGDGMFKTEDGSLGMVTHIPFARVVGKVGIDSSIKEVRGVGYMDHSWQFQTATKVFRSGYRFVHLDDAQNWDVIHFIEPQKANQSPLGYRLTSSRGRINIFSIVRADLNTRDGRKNQRLPQSFTAQQANKVNFRLQSRGTPAIRSVFSDVSWVGRQVLRTVAGGEIFDYRGQGNVIDANGTTKAGYYSFFVID